MSDMLPHALAYARRGLRVIPLYQPWCGGCTCADPNCTSKGKHPRNEHGIKDASSDPEVIRSWWERWPEANIGIITGETFWALDVDPRHGGDKTLAELVAKHGTLPDTVRVLTGGGGTHFYFAMNSAQIRKRSGFMPGLDTQRGGLVVAPPSVHVSGREYQFDPTAPKALALAPAWLVDLINGPDGEKQERFDTAAALRGAPKGMRDETLFKLACKLRNADVPFAEVLELILRSARNCEPPFPEDQARAKVENAFRRYEPKATLASARGEPPPHLTDLGNARRLVARHGDKNLFRESCAGLDITHERFRIASSREI